MFQIDWKNLEKNAQSIRDAWAESWASLDTMPSITAEVAQNILDVLIERTHLDILEHFNDASKVFPTKQGYSDRLLKVNNLWWVDHATAGISGWGTLDWFSSRLVKHSLPFNTEEEANAKAAQKAKYHATTYARGGKWVVEWMGLAEASTHFVVFQDGRPFMLL